jgi:hypothetical protein
MDMDAFRYTGDMATLNEGRQVFSYIFFNGARTCISAMKTYDKGAVPVAYYNVDAQSLYRYQALHKRSGEGLYPEHLILPAYRGFGGNSGKPVIIIDLYIRKKNKKACR